MFNKAEKEIHSKKITAVRKDSTHSWLMKYSVTFIILCLLVYSLQIFYGKSFVYTGDSLSGDGLVQVYNLLAYYGEWLRNIFKNFFIEQSFCIPEYDLSIGLGGDIITTLNFFVLGDPLNLLAVFVPMRYTEVLYNALVILRLYLAGLSFYFYCLYHSYESDRILPGAVIYVFSFYTIVISVLHPHFLNPLIYFPVILVGIDKILKERKPLLFIISSAVGAVCNFYFFYMITILMSIYGVIRYIQIHGKKVKILHLIKELGRFLVYYCIAVMLAAPVFIPTALVVLGSSRIGNTGTVPKLYELIYYIKLPIAFMNASADHYAALGYGAVALLAVIMLFFRTKWKERAIFKIALIAGTIFLLFPFFGHVLNGFGYATNRWIWAYCFIISLIVVEMFPDITGLPGKVKWIMAGITILFEVPTFYFRSEGNKEKLLAAAAVLFVSGIVLALAVLLCGRLKRGMSKACLVVTAVNIFLSMFGFYSPLSGNDINRHGNIGSAWQDITSGPLSVLETGEYENFRIDTSNLYFSGVRANSAMLYDVNSVPFYCSVINENISDFIHDMWIPIPYENRYVDLDSRVMLETALGVKYMIIKSGDELYLPYSYSNPVKEKDGYALYETEMALPMAFMYDTIIEEQEYKNFTPVEKQQAALQAAAVDDSSLSKSSSDFIHFSDTVSAYTIVKSEGLEMGENYLEVKVPEAYITIRTDRVQDAERYFAFNNLYYEGGNNAYISISDGIVSKKFEVKNSHDTLYAGIHNFLCNLGYSGYHGEEYTVSFSNPGIYTYDDLEIINQPLDCMEEWIAERKEIPVEYAFEGDSMYLQVDSDRGGLLYISIPYSGGWKAVVDGKAAEILKTNDFGIGVYILPGEHTVEFEYHTPYSGQGWMLMIIGILGCITLAFYDRAAERINKKGRKL
ncbi:MAG: YfhO family protein [Lachnospiraceae bacterium]|nr:YfhO family protein [Lachnospiraceae bacterium]